MNVIINNESLYFRSITNAAERVSHKSNFMLKNIITSKKKPKDMSILKSTFILNSVLVILSADITPPIEPNGLGISKGILTFSVISNIC